MPNPVTKIRFANGLQVNLKEIHIAPLVSHWVWYRVGSRNEKPGKTGMSHWVEHMQFKGTPLFPNGNLDKAISRQGGSWNAMTYLDWTAYYEKMPADHIDLALRLEADRMTNSLYEPAEVESERTVIISEREGKENEPLFRLDEAIQLAAFDRHPYRYEVIGDKQDLWKITREDLYEHYRRYYTPNNMLISVAGDFNTGELLTRLEELYGGLPARSEIDDRVEIEQPLSAERQIEVSGPGETSYLRLAYRAPAASNPDFFVFTVLDSLLSGPSGLMMSGGGLSNKTSRLYRALVEQKLAISVSGGLQATIDPFLYVITAIVHPHSTPQAVLQAIDAEIERLQSQQVAASEISRAIKQARALFAYGSENITNQAFWLGYSEMFSTYDWFIHYMQSLEQVTPKDVLRISQEYLQPARRVAGVYLPTGEEEVAA
ncbi:MAG TPA: pitrilysin family protein [Levilinea sp.]|nr:pitrilysin family protein [Levilinea sp.]